MLQAVRPEIPGKHASGNIEGQNNIDTFGGDILELVSFCGRASTMISSVIAITGKQIKYGGDNFGMLPLLC